MEAKTETVAKIKKLIEDEKIVLGTNVTLKELKKGNLSKVYLSSNVPASVKEDIEHYAKIADVEVVVTQLTNEDFGVICKKSFLISVSGQKK
ncbi:hypothetical protein BVX95_02110 [archaeon D22]|nr:hypothetical protein BVX95_02110 [archaeon D22]